jgi:acetyl-CoA carboxylase biotin carboxyl carrier protein
VAEEAPNEGNPVDVETIRRLVALMSRNDLSEIDLKHGANRIRLRRGSRIKTITAPLAPAAPPVNPAPPPAAAAAPVEAAPPARHLVGIKSPTVGTFYNREKPEAAPYVTRGSKVTPTTVVGLIEAMKLFNEVQAECSGTIVEVLVDNAQSVDYHTVLFRVDPSA